jgi:hypothetical protein
MEGILSNDNLIKTGGKINAFRQSLMAIGGHEYTRNELNETLADVLGISPKTAANAMREIKRAWPGIITERKEGKTKIFNVSSTLK